MEVNIFKKGQKTTHRQKMRTKKKKKSETQQRREHQGWRKLSDGDALMGDMR